MTTTRKTAWAAGFGDLPMVAGDTIDGVVQVVLDDLIEHLTWGSMAPDDADGEGITIYGDVTWCVGNDGEDCDCGQNHRDADGAWLLMSHGQRRKLLVQVIRPATDDGDFDVVLAAEVLAAEVTP